MGERANETAKRFEDAVANLAKLVEDCPEDKWNAICNDEGWSVAATAQHVSGQFPLEREYIVAAAEGKEMPSYSWDDINGKNDNRAKANTSASKADVLKELREGATSMAAYVRALSDEQLDRTGNLPLAGGAAVSTQQLLDGGVLIDHVNGHAASIKAAQ